MLMNWWLSTRSVDELITIMIRKARAYNEQVRILSVMATRKGMESAVFHFPLIQLTTMIIDVKLPTEEATFTAQMKLLNYAKDCLYDLEKELIKDKKEAKLAK
jgi:hypothetical protein